MNKLLRVALYARVSSQKQANEKTIDSQIRELQDRIVQDGQTLQSEFQFCDDGWSGSELWRPQLERLRDHVHWGAIDRLYIHSPDRLCRKTTHHAILMEEFKKCKCEVIFLNQVALPESAETNLMLQIQSVIAEYEREKILERTRRGKKHSAMSGNVSVFGHAPYGYDYIKKSDSGPAKWHVNATHSEHVKLIFSLVVRHGYSLNKVVRHLHDQSIKTATGKEKWDTATIHGILTNPAYHGTAIYGKTQFLPRKNHKRPNKGCPAIPRNSKVASARVDGEQFSIAVPAIIDKDLFNQAQVIMKENQRLQRERSQGSNYLLSGLVTCGRCGSAYCARKNGHTLQYFYYRCISSDKHRAKSRPICQSSSIRGDELDQLVWQEVCKLLQDPARIRHELTRQPSQLAGTQQQMQELERSVATTQDRIARLIDIYETGLIEKEQFTSRVKPLQEKLNRDKTKLEGATKEVNSTSIEQATASFEAFSQAVSSKLNAADATLKRELCKLLIERIEISDSDVHITYKVPQNPFALGPDNGAFLQHCLTIAETPSG